MTNLRWFPLLAAALLLAAGPLAAQDKPQDKPQDWDGKIVREIRHPGFRRHSWNNFRHKLHLREGETYTRDKYDRDISTLWKTYLFEKVAIKVEFAADDPDRLIVTVEVREYEIIDVVEIEGASAITVEKLKADLRVSTGSMLNPALLKQDAEKMRNQYLEEGHHFSTVEPETVETPTGVLLRWKITEGPKVSVERTTFTGNAGIDASELEDKMAVKSTSWIFGVIPLERKPFVMKHLIQDLERIKLFYYDKGWLDILHGDRIFLSNLRFNRDKTRAFVTIHIDEGPRYTVRSVSARGNKVLADEELHPKIRAREGEPYDGEKIALDVRRLRDAYGERAYINAQIVPQTVIPESGHEIDLVYRITENDKAYVGTLTFTGNTKTRDDVLRREFTRRGFVPGEPFNSVAFGRALRSLRDKGWIDPQSPQGGLRPRWEAAGPATPEIQDVVIDISEADTGSLRFAAGYSSAYGILGVIELTQRNFDIADLPDSIDEIFNGKAFTGGGQTLRLVASPAARRQVYTLDFIEPYFFGSELGSNFRIFRQTLVRESWDEEKVGAGVGFDKRLGDFSAGIMFEGMRLIFEDVEVDAPTNIQNLAGDNLVYTLTPRLIFDTRDSILIPSEGQRLSLSWEYAGQFMAGDFDYNKYILDTDFFFPVLETESGLKHVLALELTVGYVKPARRAGEVPISERFFLGGRGTMRGFDFRGIGPRENGDPVGDNVLVFGSVEYLFPLFTEVLRGALFFDTGTLEDEWGDLHKSKFRKSIGFGIRFIVPQLGNVPVSLDFGWPLWKDDDDDRRTITFDIGRLF